MYLTYYNLTRQPFHITPDPEFLYLSPSHKEALAAIIYGVEQKKGFVAITGDVGAGKTTILRSYLDTARKTNLKIVYVFNAKLTFEGLLRTVFQELHLPREGADVQEMVDRLYEVLIEEYKGGNTVVLVIDEVQNMPADTLESLRMLSNLETSKDKLIQIVLVGQPEFEEELNQKRLRQLKQRLAIRATILPLTRNESLEYIRFRLIKAGVSPSSVFTEPALNMIVKRAKGIPRVINILCDNSLITGLGYRERPITKRIVKEIVRDTNRAGRVSRRRWWLPAAAMLVLLAIAGFAWLFLRDGDALRRMRSVAFSERPVIHIPVTEVSGAAPVVRREPVMLPAPPKEEAALAEKKGEPGVVQKTVSRGDTLSRLVREVYGVSDDRLVKLVREGNRQIADPDIIQPGSIITFPDVPTQKDQAK